MWNPLVDSLVTEELLMSIRLCISGIYGRMGKLVEKLARQDRTIDEVVGIELSGQGVLPDGVFNQTRLDEALRKSDVLLVFTNDPASVVEQARAAVRQDVRVVIGTTGLLPPQLAALRKCSEKVSVLQASNFSLGVTLFANQMAQAAVVLDESYEVEIVEEHHGRKLDAPSGTALMLARVICEARGWDPEVAIQCGRSGRAGTPRLTQIVGIQSVRAGNIAGNHEVIFVGPNEQLRYKHSAGGPEVFAEGALTAVKWIANEGPGWYSMNQVLGLS